VALEAMAVGKPIVASRCRSGPAELTKNGKFGVLVRPEDHIGLANAILRACEDHEGRTKLGASARRHVIETYTWSQVSFAYLKLLGRVK
jgi:glycosyltransferase involved in cell wall biosynthesis